MTHLSRAPTYARRPSQRGDVLLFVLVSLLILLLGALYLMREQFNDSFFAGNSLQRQKNVHVADQALALAFEEIERTLRATDGGMTLDVAVKVSADQANWFLSPTGSEAWPAPGALESINEGYWSLCSERNADKPCTKLCSDASQQLPCDPAQLPAYYVATMVVVPTNLHPDVHLCATTGYVAMFYSVFVHVQEAKSGKQLGPTSATVESVFRQCVRDLT